MVQCAICGKDNPPGTEYCEDCGAALAVASSGVVSGGTAPLASSPEVLPEVPSSGETVATATAANTASAAATGPDTSAPSVQAPATAPASATPAHEDAGPGASSPVTNPRLVAKRHGAVTAEEIPLQGDRLVVGRFDPESGPVDIDLSGIPEAGNLSRHHAELYREADGQWYVKDLGSTNGVFVKRPDSSTFSPRIITPSPLTPGDEVAFGNARFIFRAD